MLDVIVVPLIEREFDLLKTWLRYLPASGVEGGTLFLSIDGHWTPSLAATAREVFRRSALASENWRLQFVDCGLATTESFYLKGNRSQIDTSAFPYGTKSGPNQQFFRSLRKLRQRGVTSACILLEVDAFATRVGWLQTLDACVTATAADFLIAGSTYSGQSPLSPRIKGHCNGNSIYNLGHADFDLFLTLWERLLLHCIKQMPALAYDVVLEWFRHRESGSGSTDDAQESFEALLQLYAGATLDLQGLLVNLGGEYESRPEYRLDIGGFAAAFPKALVVHGKCFVDTIYRLRCAWTPAAAQPYAHPLNRGLDAMQRGNVDAALFSGALGPDICEVLVSSPRLLDQAQHALIKTLLARAG